MDKFRARMMGENEKDGVTKSLSRKIDKTIDSIDKSGVDGDYDEEDNDDDDLFDNDSVEMDDEERKEVDMADSLLDNEFGFGAAEVDQNKEAETLLKENSPVLRMNFTREEVETLRKRVRHPENSSS